MEPITALTVATATVQFIDFGLKSLSTCKQIRDSATNTTELHSELQQAIRQLESLQNGVTLHQYPQGTSRAVKDTSRDCSQIATEIHTLLKEIRNIAQTKRFGAFRAALLSIKEQKKIEKLQNKLEQCQSKFHTSVSVDMREQVLRILQAQDKLDKTLENVVVTELCRMGVESTAGHQKTQNSMTLYHKQTLAAHDVAQEHLRALRTSSATAAEHQARLQKEMQSRFEDVESSTQSRSTYGTFLRSLEYPEMFERHRAINPPAATTFEWIFTGEVPRDNHQSAADISAEREERLKLSRWISGPGFAFWINGKAGSGKSSLMSFLEGDARTPRLLQTWAGDCSLHTFSFFFWRPGTHLQKSIPGLLQSLLYQLVRAKPAIIESLASAGLYVPGILWTETKLLRALTAALLHFKDERTFFLIDGLDEFERDYLRLFHTLFMFETGHGRSNVKLLLSSRPEIVLSDKLRSFPSLRLQDLNTTDIAQYVKNKINDVSEQHEVLINNLIDRAEGIFLWAVLVCDSLISGIIAKDTESELQKRLDATPSGLDRLFVHMFSGLDNIYRESVATYFCLLKWAATSRLHPTIGLITVLLQGQSFTSMRHFQNECELTQRRVLAQTKGLIEVSRLEEPEPGWSITTSEGGQLHYTHAWALRDIASGGVRTNFLKAQKYDHYSSVFLKWIHRSAYDSILGTVGSASGFILSPDEESSLARRTLLAGEWMVQHRPVLVIYPSMRLMSLFIDSSVLPFLEIADAGLSANVYDSLDRIHDCLVASTYRNNGAVHHQSSSKGIGAMQRISLLIAFWTSSLTSDRFLDYAARRFDWITTCPDARALSAECLKELLGSIGRLEYVPLVLELHLQFLCDRANSCPDRSLFLFQAGTFKRMIVSSFCHGCNVPETILCAQKIDEALGRNFPEALKNFDDTDALHRTYHRLTAQIWALIEAWQLSFGSPNFDASECFTPLQILMPCPSPTSQSKGEHTYSSRHRLQFICFDQGSCSGYIERPIAVTACFKLSSRGSQELLRCLCYQGHDSLLRFSGTAEDQQRCLSLVKNELWTSWDDNFGAWQQLYFLACVKKWFKDFWVTDEQARNFWNIDIIRN